MGGPVRLIVRPENVLPKFVASLATITALNLSLFEKIEPPSVGASPWKVAEVNALYANAWVPILVTVAGIETEVS